MSLWNAGNYKEWKKFVFSISFSFFFLGWLLSSCWNCTKSRRITFVNVHTGYVILHFLFKFFSLQIMLLMQYTVRLVSYVVAFHSIKKVIIPQSTKFELFNLYTSTHKINGNTLVPKFHLWLFSYTKKEEEKRCWKLSICFVVARLLTF